MGLRRPARRGARRDLRRGARPGAPTVSTVGRVVGDIFARIDARAAFPGVLAACRAWGPDVVISETTEFAGPLAAELVGVPSVVRRHLPAGQGGARASRRSSTRSTTCARAFGLAPDPGGAAPAAPAVLHAPARRAGGSRHAGAVPRAALPRAAPRRAPPLRSTAGRRTIGRSSTSPSARSAPSMEFFPGLYRAAIDALGVPAAAPAGDRRARPRPGRRWGRCRPTCASSAGSPQADLMPHVAAMVCHGGSGTVTMGLAGGVPMAVAAALRRPAVERRARRRAGRGDRARRRSRRRSPGCARRSCGSPAIRRTASSAQRIAAEMRALPPVDAAVGVVRGLLVERLAA